LFAASQEDENYSKLTPTERQEEYLQLLKEKNKLKKQLSSKSKNDQANTDREKGNSLRTRYCYHLTTHCGPIQYSGFVTHFSGANATEKVRKQKTVSGVGKIKLEDVVMPKTADKYELMLNKILHLDKLIFIFENAEGGNDGKLNRGEMIFLNPEV
jgi:hypothetical protein